MSKIAGTTETESNGWRRHSVWSGYQMMGDDVVGEEYCTHYEAPGTDWRADFHYATVAIPDCEVYDRDGVTVIGTETRYGVDGMSEVYREVDGDQWDLEINYEDEGSPLYFPTIEAADKEGKRLALMNWSFAFSDVREEVAR